MVTTSNARSEVSVDAGEPLSLTDELILMLLNEESGYFYQVPGWNMNCALVGAAIAELTLRGRLDADMDAVILLSAEPTADPVLDEMLTEIAAESEGRNLRYWIEHFAPQGGEVLSNSLDELTERGILEHHAGEFWTISQFALQSVVERDGERIEFVKTRVRRVIFGNQLPDPRDAIIISLANACDVLRLIYELNEPFPNRIEWLSRIDLIGQAVGAAVGRSIAAPVLSRAPLTKPIPRVPLRELIFNRHLRQGRLPAFFASLAEKYGPVYQLRPPFREPMIVLAGLETNRWAHRQGRLHLRSQEYFHAVNEVYGSARSIHSMDGADHFRYRKTMQPAYSRQTLVTRLNETFDNARSHMATWEVGDTLPAQRMLRPLMNAQVSPLLTSTHTQDLIDNVLKHKMRVLNIGLIKVLPKFMLRTPTARRRAMVTDELTERILEAHTAGQREGMPRDVVDDYLNLHASDPQFLPETDLGVPMGTMLMASMYMGDQLGFALYALVKHPELYARVQAEADALFDDGDPTEADLNLENIDVTHRVLMESLRLTPIVPMAMRTVMNTCVVEGCELPVGALVYIANTAPHYMKELFPDPWKFDIDRYLPSRNEHVGEGYAPYGLGTHSCLGFRWSELHLAINLLMLAHYFKLEFASSHKQVPMDPFPSQSPSNKLKFRIAEQRRPLSR